MRIVLQLLFVLALPSLAMAQTYGLDFNGVDQTAGNTDPYFFNGIPPSGSFTMEFWVNPRSTTTLHTESTSGIDGTGNAPEFAVYPRQAGRDGGVGVAVGTNGIVVYGHGDGFFPALASKAHAINGWHHVAIVVNDDTPSIYVDAQLIHTGLKSPKRLVPSLQLGGGAYGYFNGQIDEFRIWESARTREQIQMTYLSHNLGLHFYEIVTYYKLDEGTGTSIDDFVNRNNGTTNAKWVSLPNAFNEYGIELDGIDDYVEVYDTTAQDLTNGSEGTYELWFKTTNAGSGTRGLIVRQFGAGLFLEDNQLIAYDWNSGPINTGLTVNDGNWHHVALTFKMGETNGSHIYLDGALVKTFTYTVNNGSNTTVLGAGDPAGSIQNFAGQIDEVRIWNVRRTKSQIQSSIQSNLTERNSEIQVQYYFQATSGTLVYNRANVMNPGTLHNMDDSDWVSTSPYSTILDLTPPAFENGTPAISNVTESGFDITIDVNEAGGVFMIVVPDGEAAPSSTQVKAGQNSSGGSVIYSGSSTGNLISGTDSWRHTFSVQGLTRGTSYDVYVVAQDAQTFPNLQSSPIKRDIRTLDLKPPEFENSTPTISNVNGSWFNIGIDVDETSYVYYALVPDGEAAPTSAQVKNGQRSNGSSALYSDVHYSSVSPFQWTFDVSGVLDNTAYDVYVVAEDDEASRNLQASPLKFDIATSDLSTSVNLDGATEYFSGYNDLLPFGNSAFTIEAWVYPDQMGNLTIARWGDASIGRANAFRLTSNGLLHYWWDNGADDFEVTTGNLAGAWHHLAITWDGTRRKAYLDGVLIGTQAQSDPNVALGNFVIGATNSGAEKFDGKIDELRIWNTARSQTEIVNSMGGEFAPGTANLVANYRMDGDANELVDFSGNTKNLTGTGIDGSNWTTASNRVPGPDFLAPIFENDSPSQSNINQTSFDVTVDVNERGAVFIGVLPHGEAAPSSEQVKAGQNGNGGSVLFSGGSTGNPLPNSGSWRHTFSVTGLVEGVKYDVYVVAQDDETTPNLQASPTKKTMQTFDDTRPTFEGGTPTLTNVTSYGATLDVDIDEVATIAYVVTPGGQLDAPGDWQIFNGLDAYGNPAAAAGRDTVTSGNYALTFNIAGLREDRDYDLYLIADDDQEPFSNTSYAKLDFKTTDGAASIELDGNTEFYSGTHTGLPVGSSAFTIEAWIKPHQSGSGTIIKWGNNSSGSANGLRLTANGIQHYWWSNDLEIQTGDISNEWHHIAVTYDGTTRSMYLDGTLKGKDTPSAPNVQNQNMFIGSLDGAGQFFDGNIDEVRVWSKARTQAEIVNSMRLEFPVTLNLAVYYKVVNRGTNLLYDYTFDSQQHLTGTNTDVSNYVAPVVFPTDLSAPVFEESTPSITSLSYTSFDVSLNINEQGTAYSVVVEDGAAAPSSAQVKAGQKADGTAAIASASQVISNSNFSGVTSFSGVSHNTNYDVYVVVEDDETTPNLQTTPTKLDVTTVRFPYPAFTSAPTLTANNNGFNLNINADRPGEYLWLVLDGTPIDNIPSGQIDVWIRDGVGEASGTTTINENSGTIQITGLEHSKVYQVYLFAREAFDKEPQPYATRISGQTQITYPGQAIFVSNSGFLTVSNSLISNPVSELTLESWINPSQLPGTGNVISEFWGNSGYSLQVQGDGSVIFTIGNGSSTQSVASGPNVVSTNTWSHISGVYTGSEMIVYVNGLEKNRVTFSGNVVPHSISRFGISAYKTNNPFYGLIDEVRIWNRAISQIELNANINQTYETIPSGLIRYFNFDEANGYSPIIGEGIPVAMNVASSITVTPVHDNGLLASHNGFGYSPIMEFVHGKPAVVATTITSTDIALGLNIPGNVYYVLLPANSTSPSASQIKAGDGNGQTVIQSGTVDLTTGSYESTLALTDLTYGTEYNVFFAGEDASNNMFLLNSQPFSFTTRSYRFENNTPSLTSYSSTEASVSVDLDFGLQLHYILLPAGSTAPSLSQIKAGDGNGQTVYQSGSLDLTSLDHSGSLSITGLTSGQGYTIFFAGEGAGNQLFSLSTESYTFYTETSGFGNAITFNGSSQYGIVNDASYALSGSVSEFTIESMINLSELKSSAIVDTRNGSSGFLIETTSGGHIRIVFSAGKGVVDVGSPSLLQIGKWHHVAFVCNSTSITIYVDGQEVRKVSGYGAINLSSVTSMSIGTIRSYPGSSNMFNGKIDEFRFWDVSRSASQILDNSIIPFLNSDPNLKLRYSFNQLSSNDSPQIISDRASGLNNFVVTGHPSATEVLTESNIEFKVELSSVSSTTFSPGDSFTIQGSGLTTVEASDDIWLYNPDGVTSLVNLGSQSKPTAESIEISIPASIDTTHINQPIKLIAEKSNGAILTLENIFHFQRSEESARKYFRAFNNSVIVAPNKSDFALSGRNATYELWFRTSSSVSGYQTLISKPGAMGLYLKDNKLAAFDWTIGDQYLSTQALNDGNWHHVALTSDIGLTNGTKLYLDGELVATYTQQVSSDANPLMIGADAVDASSQPFNGDIDEVRIWNIFRSESHILEKMYADLPDNTSGLLANYKLDSKASNIAFDYTANQRHGQIENGSGEWKKGKYIVTIPSNIAVQTSIPSLIIPGNSISLTANIFYALNESHSLDIFASSDGALIQNITGITLNGAQISFQIPENISTSRINEPVYLELVGGDGARSRITNNFHFENANSVYSRSFAGDYLPLPSESAFNGSSGTHELWFKTSADVTGFQGLIVKQGDFGVYLHNNLLVYYSEGRIQYQSTIPYNDGQWHHVALTWNKSGTTNLYSDGALINNFASPLTTSAPVRIGTGFTDGSDQLFSGQIDEVRIWSDIRSSVEISDSYNQPVTNPDGSLIAYYRLDSKAGDIAFDYSNYGRHITIATNSGTPQGAWSAESFVTGATPTIAFKQGYPYQATFESTSIDLSISLNNQNLSGTLYYVVLPDNATAPSAEQIKTGNGNGQTVIKSGSINIASSHTSETIQLTDLAAETKYTIFFAVEDVYSRLSLIDANGSSINTLLPDQGIALSLNGSSQYGVISDANYTQSSSALTVEAIVKPTEFKNAFIVDMLKGSVGHSLQMDNAGGLQWSLAGDSGVFSLITGSVLKLNEWNHIVAAFNGSRMDLYVNGSNVASRSYTPFQINLFEAGQPLGIGNSAHQYNAAKSFAGFMDQVRIWGIALNQSQVDQYLASTVPSTTTGLKASFSFDHVNQAGNAIVAYDVTAASNTMTLNGYADAASAVLTSSDMSNDIVPTLRVNADSSSFSPGDLISWSGNELSTISVTHSISMVDIVNGQTIVNLGNPSKPNANTVSITVPSNVDTTYINQPVVFIAESGGHKVQLGSMLHFQRSEKELRRYNWVSNGGAIVLPNKDEFSLASGNTATYEVWFKTANAGSGYRALISKHSALGVYLFENKLAVIDWSVGNVYQAPTTINDGRWHHVAVSTTIGQSNGTNLYLDGSLIATFTHSTVSDNNPVIIGADNPNGSAAFTGLIDEVRIWNTARSSEQINQSRFSTLSGSEAGLLANYRFDSKRSAKAFDYSMNQHHASIHAVSGSWLREGYRLDLPQSMNPTLLSKHYFSPGDTLKFSNNQFSGLEGNYTAKIVSLESASDLVSNLQILKNGNDLSIPMGSDISNALVNEPVKISIVSDVGLVTSFTDTLHFEAKSFAQKIYSRNMTIEHLAIPNKTVFDANDQTGGTYELWFRTNANNGEYHGLIVKQWAIGLFIAGNKIQAYDWVNNVRITTAETYNDNQWHHVALTYGSGTYTLYVDGVQYGSTTYAINHNNNPINIGTGFSNGSGQFFIGMIDEVRIWNRVRTAQEIKDSYDKPIISPDANLLAYYRLDSKSGTLAFDYSQYQHHAKVINYLNSPIGAWVPSGYQDISAPVSTSLDFTTLTTDQVNLQGEMSALGTAYYVVVGNAEETPTVAQIKLGQNAASTTALKSGSSQYSALNTPWTASITGLSPQTDYKLYLAYESSQLTREGNQHVVPFRTRALPVARDSSFVSSAGTPFQLPPQLFPFSDADNGESLQKIRIETVPAKGTFFFDQNGNGVNDDTPINQSQEITLAQLQEGKLRFTPPANEYGKGYASFTFKVGDGYSVSSESKTMTIDVHATQEQVAGTNGFNGWRMIGAPSTDDSFASLLSGIWTQGGTGGSTTSGSPNIYVWNEVTGIFDPVTDFTATVSNGQGMIAFMYEDDNPATGELDGGWPKVINHSGTNKIGINNFPVSYTSNGSGSEGFNLVANPYPFAIDWNAEGWTKSNVSSTMYVWNPNANGGNGSYELWNGITGSRGNGIIAPYQAFWIQAMGENPVLSVDETAGLSGPATLQKTTQSQTITESDVISIGIEIEQGMLSDNLQLLFHQNDSLNLSTFDAVKLPTLAQKYVQISADESDQSFAIKNYLSPDDINSVTFPIDIKTSNNEPVRISASEIANLPEHWEPMLVDTYSGEIFDLSGDEDVWEITFNKSTLAKSAGAESDSLIQPSMEIMEEEENRQPRFILALSSAVVTSLSESFLPQEFKLNQNYPNPFNPTTIIGYELPQAGHVTMEVYNIIGQKVTTLVNSTQSAGKHKIQFNGSQLTSGVYFIRMIAGKKVFTRKMVLVK